MKNGEMDQFGNSSRSKEEMNKPDYLIKISMGKNKQTQRKLTEIFDSMTKKIKERKPCVITFVAFHELLIRKVL